MPDSLPERQLREWQDRTAQAESEAARLREERDALYEAADILWTHYLLPLPPEKHERVVSLLARSLLAGVASDAASANQPSERCDYCGDIEWTAAQYGRVSHKHNCQHRTDPWCQTHPEGCGQEMDDYELPSKQARKIARVALVSRETEEPAKPPEPDPRLVRANRERDRLLAEMAEFIESVLVRPMSSGWRDELLARYRALTGPQEEGEGKVCGVCCGHHGAREGGRVSAGSVCEKCGGDEIMVRWHAGYYVTGKYDRCGIGDRDQPKGEHLHYRCDLCRYDWTGPVVAARPSDAGTDRA